MMFLMDNILIRYALSEDYSQIEEIMKQIQNLHISLAPDVYKPTATVLPYEEFQEGIHQKRFIVAEYNGNVVGMLSFFHRHIEANTQRTRNTIFINCIAVEEKYRGQGIGHELLNFAKKIVQENKYDELELQVNAKNTAARKMYEKCGFIETSINMSWPINQDV